jgi:hypothetical protein
MIQKRNECFQIGRPSPSKSTCHKSRFRSGFEALGFRLLLQITISFSDTPSSNSDLSLSEPQLCEKLSELVFLCEASSFG